MTTTLKMMVMFMVERQSILELRKYIKEAVKQGMPPQVVLANLCRNHWKPSIILDEMRRQARKERWAYFIAGLLIGISTFTILIALWAFTLSPDVVIP